MAVPLSPIPASAGQAAGGGLGLWYADVDGIMYGMFLTRSTQTDVGGYLLAYSAAGFPEWQLFGGKWQGAPGTAATGTISRCTLSKTKGISCVPTSTAFGLAISGAAAQATGVAGRADAVALQKATLLQPFLGPLV